MSSAYTLYPPTVPDPTSVRRDRVEQPRGLPTEDGQQHLSPATPIYHGHLSAFSPQLSSNSASPALNTHTPAESISTLSIHYQSSEFDEGDDPFFGVNFSSLDAASPSFFGDDILPLEGSESPDDQLAFRAAPTQTQHVRQAPAYLPLSPDKSPSLPTGSPAGERRANEVARSVFPDFTQTSVAPRELSTFTQQPPPALESKPTSLQLTPKTTDSGQSSDDGLVPAAAAMQCQSPRVTVSHWDREDDGGYRPFNAEQHPEHNDPAFSATRDAAGRWIPNQSTGQSGVDPSARSAAEGASINELAIERKLTVRNREVDSWLQRSAVLPEPNLHTTEQPADVPTDGEDNIPQREISLGNETENKPVPGQTYFVENGGEVTYEDLRLMRQGRNFEDAPLPFSISQPDSTAYQPPTSQAAMEKFQRMCRDNDSILSRAATWGTRRYSLPSMADADVEATGNFLKKLSLSRGDTTRRPSILEGLRGLVRKPSVSRDKRSRAEQDDASSFLTESSMERRESQAKLAPPSPKPGWSRKQSVPSINTAFVDVANRVAAIGATHTRAGSISATSITSPKSPSTRTLSVRKPLNRLRSKSDTSGIVDLWKKSGGPPVSNLGNSKVNAPENDDDDDDDDDLYEDGDMKAASNKLIDDITPNFAGFQQHVLKLNPLLSTTNNYLVDRIAHQQCVRYKQLLNSRVKHLQAIAARNCSCGSMCIALGGSANILDAKGDLRGADPLSARFDGEDGDITPLEGAINPESFPDDIPMPPTSTLPAEFECQLCFTAKKFQKPSDWTKHVHEDVQPFTCTWERCRDPKIFKRKADWVRHENEGHRHLEWWICDVEDCRHVCYRRDNFLQHLVREHKYVEPKVKTKAAIKRAGGIDPTWAKVEKCHQETPELPQNEPCRFCGRTFPTWKKLTVHLAKHMEQISLPILKLVARKDLDEDTIISPVQEPPPRSFPTTFTHKPELQHPFGPSPTLPQGQHPMGYPNQQPQGLGMYPIAPPQGYPQGLYSPNGFDDLSHGMAQAQIGGMQHHHQHQHQHQHHQLPSHGHSHSHGGFQSLNTQFQNMPVPSSSAAAFPNLPVTSSAAAAFPNLPVTSSGGYMQGNGYMSMSPDMEPFPVLGGGGGMNALGLQDPTGGMGYAAGGSGGGGGGMVDVEQFTPQGSVSPYGHSPHQPQGGFYHP